MLPGNEQLIALLGGVDTQIAFFDASQGILMHFHAHFDALKECMDDPAGRH